MKILSIVILSLCHTISVYGQPIPFTSDNWDIQATSSEISEYKGKESLLLKGGFALLKDVEFLNGIIEFDVIFPQKRGFIGITFRHQDNGNYEEFYMRPHQSGNPDANQYSPVFNYSQSWQLYHGKGHGAAVVYKFDQWMHVKIVIADNKGEIFIMDMQKPALVLNDLKRPLESGKIGLRVSDYVPGRFANFSYTLIDGPNLIADTTTDKKSDNGLVRKWAVSNAFEEERLKDIQSLSKKQIENNIWSDIITENTGLVNLSKIGEIRKGNTVFAKISIQSDNVRIKEFNFGYSDRIKIFLNGQLYYSGTNRYRSRDYRYLGTIGYFDSVHLPLKEGVNTLIVAVSEDFGGWGLQGRFPDETGIIIE